MLVIVLERDRGVWGVLVFVANVLVGTVMGGIVRTCGDVSVTRHRERVKRDRVRGLTPARTCS